MELWFRLPKQNHFNHCSTFCNPIIKSIKTTLIIELTLWDDVRVHDKKPLPHKFCYFIKEYYSLHEEYYKM